METILKEKPVIKAFLQSKLQRSFLAIVIAYLATRALSLTAYADDGTDAFTQQVDTTGSTNIFADIVNGFIPPLQGFGASVLVVCMIVTGIKLGTSSMFQDPRGRMEAIKSIFFIVIGGAIVIHAKQIVGFAARVTMGQS